MDQGDFAVLRICFNKQHFIANFICPIIYNLIYS